MQGALFKTLPLIATEEGRICNQITRFQQQNSAFLVYWARVMPLLIDGHAMPCVFKRSPGQKLVTTTTAADNSLGEPWTSSLADTYVKIFPSNSIT